LGFGDGRDPLRFAFRFGNLLARFCFNLRDFVLRVARPAALESLG
jgi:hypothetical protein